MPLHCPPPEGHSHDDTGGVVLANSTALNQPDASGVDSVAVGGAASGFSGADADGTQAVAIGRSSFALGDASVAVGRDAVTEAVDAVAIGDATWVGGVGGVALGNSASCEHARSVALGDAQFTTGDDQVNLASKRLFFGTPNSAAADALLFSNSQATFYLNEADNTLVVKVKYSTGVIKTGAVALL